MTTLKMAARETNLYVDENKEYLYKPLLSQKERILKQK